MYYAELGDGRKHTTCSSMSWLHTFSVCLPFNMAMAFEPSAIVGCITPIYTYFSKVIYNSNSMLCRSTFDGDKLIFH